MFVFTARGAAKEISRSLERLDALEPRLDKLRKIQTESEILGLPDDGSADFIAQIENGSSQMYEDLRRARHLVMGEPERWREVLPLLKQCEEELKAVHKTLDEIQIAINKAEIQVRQDLGRL